MIGYGGPPGHIRAVSFASVLRGEVPASLIRNAYILVGATAQGLGDQYSTPVSGDSGVMSGVEIQANLLDTLLNGRSVHAAPVVARIAVALAAAGLLLWGFLRLKPASAAALWLGLIVGVIISSFVLLAVAHIWLAPFAAVLTLMAAQPLWAWRRLNAVSAYMLEELSRLAKEPGLLARVHPRQLGQDRLASQIELMEDTVAQVRALRRLVSTAIQNLPDATVLVDLAGRVVLANSAASRLFGPAGAISPADVERCFAGSGEPLPPFDPAALADPGRPWTIERTAADGSIREIRHEAWLDHEAPVGWVVRFSDITALRLAQKRREETLQLLTHDMRAPQASILALIAQNAAAAPGRLMERISHYAHRTIALADGFLHLARADAGGYDLTPIDLADVLVQAVDDLWPQSSTREIVITTAGADTEQMVAGDGALLTRALVNLIGNAIKFSQAGGRIDCSLEMRTDLDGAAWVLCKVADHGAGMSSETVSRLFGRFRHRPAEDGRKVDGVGLGLTFVHSVAMGHGGTIVCTSAVGQGSTFTLSLPALPTG